MVNNSAKRALIPMHEIPPFFDDDSYGRLMEIGTNDCYLRSI